MKINITSGEAIGEAFKSTWSRIALYTVVAWSGVLLGVHLTYGIESLWDGNPLSWLFFQSLALKHLWGYFFFFLQALACYTWTFTNTFRILSLSVAFVANFAQLYVIKEVLHVDPQWFIIAGLISLILIGTYAGWRIYRIIFFRN